MKNMTDFQRAVLIVLIVIAVALVYLVYDNRQEYQLGDLAEDLKVAAEKAEEERRAAAEKAQLEAKARCRFAQLDARAFYQVNKDSEVLGAETVRKVAEERLRNGCGQEARLEDYPEILE